MAKLHFVYGAMNSGKSDTLIKTAYNYTEQGLRVVTLKPAHDTKGGSSIVARAGGSWVVDLLVSEKTDINSWLKQNISTAHSTVDCILVDESQFLTPKHIDQLYSIAKHYDISVVAYGIRTDFRSKLFPGSKRLLEVADVITKLATMCRCGSQAEFNCRMIDGAFVFDGSQVAIDGAHDVRYTSLCGTCYLEQKMRYNRDKRIQSVSRPI